MVETKTDRRKFLLDRTKDVLGQAPELRSLLTRLIAEGGEFVILPVIEEDYDSIMERGRLWTPRWLKEMPGRESQCHYNSAALWDANKDKVRLCTGYALSDDGLQIWRQHSWCLEKKNVVIETTEPRLLYFGFEMTPEEANQFYMENAF